MSWKGNASSSASPHQEANFPNTVDDCKDGDSGLYVYSNGKPDSECVETITVEAVGGGNLSKGKPVTITATINDLYASDKAGFYLTGNPGTGAIWDYIETQLNL